VTITGDSFVPARVIEKTRNGFRIEIASSQSVDVSFDWIALLVTGIVETTSPSIVVPPPPEAPV
jgi:hypothetical protein